jgi:hypothetical protein
MNRTRIAYIAVTALFCLIIAPSGVLDIVQPSFVVDAMELIDLPLHLITLIGVWKLLGILALAMPRFTRINEWAYAGFFFDLTGAAYLHGAAGDTVQSVVTPLVFLVPLFASYALRSKRNASVDAALA